MKKTVLWYGLLLAVLAFTLKIIEYRWLVRDMSGAMYVFIIAMVFMGLGVWFSRQWFTTNPEVFERNDQAIKALGLSERELQVLNEMLKGQNNQGIADALYISVNTVKTHLKNSFIKLEVSNRMQASEKLRALRIFPK